MDLRRRVSQAEQHFSIPKVKDPPPAIVEVRVDSREEAKAFRALTHAPGGARLDRIPAGPVTVGELAELVRRPGG